MHNIWITTKKELRTTIRDKKSLQMMIIGPLLIPICILLFAFAYETMFVNMQVETFTIGVNYELSEQEKIIIGDNYLESVFYETEEELSVAYQDGAIDGYILNNGINYTIFSNPSENASSQCGNLAKKYLEEYNDVLAREYLETVDIDFDKIDNNITISEESLTGDNSMAALILDLGVTFGIMAILLVAIYCVTDSIAGEKEHGTLETLLTFPINTKELILGKYLAVSISCVATAIVCLVLIVVSSLLAENLFSVCAGMTQYMTIATVACSLLIMLSFSLFASALCIAVASFSKSYKEAQSTLTPISYVAMIPMFLQLFGIGLNLILSAVPCISHMMLMSNIFCTGLNTTALIQLLISTVSTTICTAVIVYVITKLYNGEKVLFSN